MQQLQEQLIQQKTELIKYPRNQNTVRPRFQVTRRKVGETNQSIEEIRQNPVGVRSVRQRFQQIQQLQGSIAQLIADVSELLQPQSYPDTSR